MEITLDVISFRQDDLPRNAFAAFEEMRKVDQFCDLTIRVQDRCFRAHRVIVAGVIPYFRTAFTCSKTEKEGFGVDDLDPSALESLIDFAYSGEVSISLENVRSLLKASHFLLMNQVRDACVEFLTERLRVDNVIQTRMLGQSLNNLNLVTSCDLYVRKNFEEFAKCDDFCGLPHSCVKEFISQDDLNVSSEEIVLKAVLKWVKVSPSDEHVVLPDLLSEVRMTYLPIECLMNLALSEELIATSIPCRNLIDEAKNYHLSKGQCVVSNLKTEPRRNTARESDPAEACCTTTTKGEIYAVYWNYCGSIIVHHCDFVQKKWGRVAKQKLYDQFSFAAATNEKIYMFFARTILTFHPKTNKWELLKSAHEKIVAFSVVFHEDVIYCFDQSSGDSVKMYCFDTNLNKWLEREKMLDRQCSAAASLGDSIYLTGGCVGGSFSFGHMKVENDNSIVSKVEKYNPATNQWSEVSPMLLARYSHGCTSLNQRIYVCGGVGVNRVFLAEAEVYDPFTNRWNFISSMKTPRSYFSLVSCNNEICAVGGRARTLIPLKTETLNPDEESWNARFCEPCHYQSVVSVPAAIT